MPIVLRCTTRSRAPNGKPEWEQEIRTTFSQRWIEKAPAGWWVQDTRGNWTRK